jgi:dUTP pyrophosphatase
MTYHEAVYFDVSDDDFLPRKSTIRSVGYDVRSSQYVVIGSGKYATVETGINRIYLPTNVEAQIRPRSGLASKFGITVLNSPGTIDPDYEGPLKVILVNHGELDFTVEIGMKIAQIVFSQITQVSLHRSNQVRTGGFGSTG